MLPIDEESQQAAAATVGLEEYASAGAASDLLDVKASVEGNELHAVPSSDVLGNMHAWCPAATDLHAAPNSDGMETVFGLHGASGVAATDLPAATIMDGLVFFQMVSSACMLSEVMVVLPVSWGTLAALLFAVMIC